MRGLWQLTWLETKLVLREPLASFFTILFPLMLLVLFGVIFGNTPSGGRGTGFVDGAVPAYTAMILATSGLLTLNMNLVTYRETGVLRRLAVTPIRPLALLGAQIVVMLVMSTLGMALLVVAGVALFGLRCDGDPIVIGAVFALSALSMFSLGFMLGSVLPTVRTAQAVGMACFYPMVFLSGAAIPRALLPDRVQQAAAAFPLTHVVTLLDAVWKGEAWSVHLAETAIVIGTMVVGAAVSARHFRWE